MTNTPITVITRAADGKGGKPYGMPMTEDTREALKHIQEKNAKYRQEVYKGKLQDIKRLPSFSEIISTLVAKEAKRLGWHKEV